MRVDNRYREEQCGCGLAHAENAAASRCHMHGERVILWVNFLWIGMQKLSSGCMNLCVWACDILKSKGQGAIGYRERVKCHRLRGALRYKEDCRTKSLSMLRKTVHAVCHDIWKCRRQRNACTMKADLQMMLMLMIRYIIFIYSLFACDCVWQKLLCD